ncbi:MAG: VOC family protein [candidate division Zixibacteria bacterium]|nr:VOC family protein [candidate division Zixibacteria bacterium]
MATNKQAIGSIGWVDLTVDDADGIRDFYKRVAGWTHSDVSMGDYSDYAMNRPDDGTPTAGVGHKKGINAGIPSQWLIYIVVANLDDSIAQCTELGGTVLIGPKGMGPGARYCVIQDPAGAVAALYEES